MVIMQFCGRSDGSGYMVQISKTTNLHARKKEAMKNKISRRNFL
jgi:hypothetical protein